MSLPTGHFEPVHEAHSIEQVVIRVQLSQFLNSDQIQSLKRASESLKGRLPGLADIRTMAIGIGGPIPTVPPLGGGFSRHAVARNGAIETELVVEGNSITYRTTVYSRWNAVWGEASEVLKPVLKAIPSEILLLGTGLQYSDKFVWSGEPTACRAKELLQTDSPYICSHVFEASDLWHSHTGLFRNVNDNTIKRLLVVNLDCIDEAGEGITAQRIVRITTALTDSLNQPGFNSVSITAKDAIDYIYERQEELHRESKAVFSKIVTLPIMQRIALTSEP